MFAWLLATPIRSLLSRFPSVRVLQGEVTSLDLDANKVQADFGELEYDYLILACGARHSYFGHDPWEEFAPGLKTIEDATSLRRRILGAFEAAELEKDPQRRRSYLNFVVVGGGPTGVELAGALSELARSLRRYI